MSIGRDVILGENVIIHHPEQVNLYGCTIGRNTKIASFVEIQKNVKVGENCKIEPFAFIPEGVTVEDEVFIGPHACFTNDERPQATNLEGKLQRESDWEIVPTVVRKGASIGANATIICGVTIGKGALVGAGAVVTKDVPDGATVIGNPARVVVTK